MSIIRNWHPAAEAFPLLEGDEFQRFVEDIRANGVRKPIEVYRGERWLGYRGYGIDGRNRAAACTALGIEAPVRWLTDADLGPAESLTAYIVSVNVARRHLSSSQAALVGVEIKRQLEVEAKSRSLANLKRGEEVPETQIFESRETPTQTSVDGRESAQEAAQIVGTNRQYVYAAEKIEALAPKLLAPIRSGALTINQANLALKRREQAPEAFAALEEGRIGFAEFREACRAARKPPAAAPAAPGDVVDVLGNPVPGELVPVFTEIVPKMELFCEMLERMSQAAKTWDSGTNADGVQAVVLAGRMQEALRAAREGIPYCICPRCTQPAEEGDDATIICPLCLGAKYLTERVYVRIRETILQMEASGALAHIEGMDCEAVA